MWVLANRDGALRAAHRRASPPGSILISVRDLGWECALIFRLKTLRRVARAAVEMHLMGSGAGVALEGRKAGYNRSQMFCTVTVTSPVARVYASDRSGPVYDISGSSWIIIRDTRIMSNYYLARK